MEADNQLQIDTENSPVNVSPSDDLVKHEIGGFGRIYTVTCILIVLFFVPYIYRNCPDYSWATGSCKVSETKLFNSLTLTNLYLLGGYFGGFLGPVVAWLAIKALLTTTKKQLDFANEQLNREISKNESLQEEKKLKKAETSQQDDFTRKFDSYKDVINQITNQMLYPWAKNEPAVSGKTALAIWLELIRRESIDTNQGGPHRVEMLITGHLIQFMRPQGVGGSRFDAEQLEYMNNPSSLFFINDFFNNIELSPLQTMMDQHGVSINDIANMQHIRLRLNSGGKSVVIPILDNNLAKRVGNVMWFFKTNNWRKLLKQDICSACEFEELGVYFRAVYHVLKSQKCDNKQAKENIRFFRSQLTETELVLIALNILFHSEGERELLPLVKQFGLLNHLFKFQNLYEIIETEPNYGKECFKEIE